MDRNRWLIFGFAIIAALSWLVFSAKNNSTSVDNVNAFSIQREGNIADNIYGNPDAKVVLFEYGDFACPGCRSAYPRVAEVKEKYKDQIAVVFRHLPLTNIHPNALAAATAAEAAGNQGKFWEMHDLLFENQTSWESLSTDTRTQAFEGYASQLGLDVAKFSEDQKDPAVAEKIAFDRALARKINATSTPTFYINDQLLSSEDWNQDGALEAKIIEALEREGVSLLEGSESPDVNTVESPITDEPNNEPTDTE